MSTVPFYRTSAAHMFTTQPHPPQEAIDNFVTQAADVFREMGVRGIDGSIGDQSGLSPTDCWLLRLLAEMVAAVVDTTPETTAIHREENADE
jgi:hypothetical protein